MRRGDIWLFDFDPPRGSEAAKVRPAVVVSNDGANLAASRTTAGVVTVVPLTTNTQTVYPFQALLTPDETGLQHTVEGSGRAGAVTRPSSAPPATSGWCASPR